MSHTAFYCAGTTPAAQYTAMFLKKSGFPFSTEPGLGTRHLLLDVPSFRDGKLRNGDTPDTLLSALPADVHIWGGNLQHPSLSHFHTTDLLRDEKYLTENAAITADCALNIAAPLLKSSWSKTPVLIIGWGRIGKCLGAQLLKAGCVPVISTKDPAHQKEILEAGYACADTTMLNPILSNFQLIFNTAPASVISEHQSQLCRNCIKIDLASVKGIEGPDVIWARGLPGIHAPRQSGKLIADTIIKHIKEETK